MKKVFTTLAICAICVSLCGGKMIAQNRQSLNFNPLQDLKEGSQQPMGKLYFEPAPEDEDAAVEEKILNDSIDFEFTPLNFLPAGRLPNIAFMPVVYDGLPHIDSLKLDDPEPLLASDIESLNWVKWLNLQSRAYQELKTRYMLDNVRSVRYNINTLPKPPAKYEAVVDPSTATIVINEIRTSVNETGNLADNNFKRTYWLHTFNASMQFSQAYISPNWYQGGTNNVNLLGRANYNIKLNPTFYPNYIVDGTFAYKVGVTSAPQDKVHNYLINDDLFQFNGLLGLKAFKHWYYSLTTMFKTQLFKSYPSNSRTVNSAFLSPGELNVGLGLTFNFNDPKRGFKIDASIAPISYNMKMSTNHRVNEENFGIKPGHKTVSQIGSNGEIKVAWNIMWNISYNTRLFVFTDYKYVMSDWEHTINFSVNKYLSTQLYLHMRYDSSRPSYNGWKKFQMKEILSFGLQYQFKTI